MDARMTRTVCWVEICAIEALESTQGRYERIYAYMQSPGMDVCILGNRPKIAVPLAPDLPHLLLGSTHNRNGVRCIGLFVTSASNT